MNGTNVTSRAGGMTGIRTGRRRVNGYLSYVLYSWKKQKNKTENKKEVVHWIANKGFDFSQ